MIVKTNAIFVIMCLLLIGCDAKEKDEEPKGAILEQQLKAIEKAKEVEQVLLEAAQRREALIE